MLYHVIVYDCYYMCICIYTYTYIMYTPAPGSGQQLVVHVVAHPAEDGY